MSVDPTKENEVIGEFFENLQKDSNRPGNVISGCLPIDVEDIVEDLMYVREFNSAVILINRVPGQYEFNVETVTRSKDDIRLSLDETRRFIVNSFAAFNKDKEKGLIEFLQNSGVALIKVKK